MDDAELGPEEVLGADVTRLLSDKMYERRTQAATQIEAQVREATQSNPRRVQQIIHCLRHGYIESTQSNHRKGGLIGLASVALGLDKEINRFLGQLIHPVLNLFKDEDPRVRYYACEALYNISKVGDDAVLAHFNEIFEGVCKLVADSATDVKEGVQVLDRLMKEIVSQSATSSSPAGGTSTSAAAAAFRVEDFVPLLATRMFTVTSSSTQQTSSRQLVLNWMQHLCELPEIDVVRHLSQYLEALFIMLNDKGNDIRQLAHNCLELLIKSVTANGPSEKALGIIESTTDIVVRCCKAANKEVRLTALQWLHEYVLLESKAMQNQSRPSAGWLDLLTDVLEGTLHCIDDAEDENIARMAVEQHSALLEMVQHLSGSIPTESLVDKLLQSMQTKISMVVQTACLQWVCLLLLRWPEQMLRRGTLHRILAPVFDTLLHPEDEVVAAALQVLAQVMEGRGSDASDDLFTVVAQRLLHIFGSDRDKMAEGEKRNKMLETRGRLMIRQLCGHLDPRRFFVTIARAIHDGIDRDFAQQLVQTFGWILLTAKETKILREELLLTPALTEFPRRTGSARDSSTHLFLELIEPWFHNPVSALALCLWAQQYELATELTARFATVEPTLEFLKQLDQLVHLLESPVFSRLRLRLLEPRRYPALVKCLLGLAMLLPQASAFNILRERINVVQSGLLLEATASGKDDLRGFRHQEPVCTVNHASEKASASGEDLAGLLVRFDAIVQAAP